MGYATGGNDPTALYDQGDRTTADYLDDTMPLVVATREAVRDAMHQLILSRAAAMLMDANRGINEGEDITRLVGMADGLIEAARIVRMWL